MENQAIIERGNQAEILLKHETFSFIVKTIEYGLVQEMFASAPHEAKKREFVYAKQQALKEIHTTLVDWVNEKEQILENEEG